jgi:hypothetical protein
MLSPVVSQVKLGKAKKHVFGSSVGYRVGGCQTLACALASLHLHEISRFCGYM